MKMAIDEKITMKREDNFRRLLIDCDVALEQLESMCAPIIDSCTKDAISVCAPA